MTDYGKGAAIGGAAVLPATSAIAFIQPLHPMVLAGFVAINVLWLAIVAAHITRYLVNKNSK